MMNNAFMQFMLANLPALKQKLIEQGYLVGSAVGLALLVGIPLGIWVLRLPKIRTFVLSFVSALWTIPSLALLAFFVPFLGIGIKPAVITLSLYALLPILRNTVAGLAGVSEASIEAAQGLGFTRLQRLWIVELPLALPVIIAGIRTAVSMSVGIATLAAFIGAGGLGDFINQGLALNNNRLILLGAVPAALMALLLDFFIAQIEKLITTKSYRYNHIGRVKLAVITLITLFVVGGFGKIYLAFLLKNKNNTVVIGTKNFTEQIVIGELMTQLLEHKTNLDVVRKFNLGSTAICQTAMLKGAIDIYPEYTGTAYLLVLDKPYTHKTPAQIYQEVRAAYKKRFNIIWLSPFGFNNTEAIAVRKQFAARYHLQTISDLAPIEKKLIIGVPPAFMKRPDGFKGLVKTYHLHFGEIKQMNMGLMYQAIKNDDVNVITAYSTDGRIPAYHLVLLKDNRNFYPPYYAAAIVRGDVLKAHPQIMQVLKPLFGLINNKIMEHLNYEVNVGDKSPARVARQFLLENGLLN